MWRIWTGSRLENVPGPRTGPYGTYAFSDLAQSSTDMQRKAFIYLLSNTPSIATNGFMVQAYQVPDANKVHRHVALLQCSLWHPSRPTPGVINSRERLRAPVIGGRTARDVVGTPTPGNGGQGRSYCSSGTGRTMRGIPPCCTHPRTRTPPCNPSRSSRRCVRSCAYVM